MARRRAPGLADRVAALDRLLELASDRLPAEQVAAAHVLRGKVSERLAHGDELVVAALVGGTGTGKSSLFNALVGADLAPVGVRRPTTEIARAAVAADPATSGRLLDWLDVRQRHDVRRPDDEAVPQQDDRHLPDGLVLLDVPDHDSIAVEHHRIVDRLVERVDVLLWVVDPLKYAMRSLHRGYLARLAAHAEVVVVVLNRCDELSPEEREACAADLRRLLDDEGLQRARLLETSARTGAGLPALRRLLADEAAAHSAAARRLVGDLRTLAGELAGAVGDEPAGALDDSGLAQALAGAAGVAGVAATAAAESRAEALDGTRPVLSRLVHATLGRGPELLRRLGRRPSAARARASATSVGVQHAVNEVVDRAAGPLPSSWRRRLVAASGVDSGALARALAAAVDAVPLRNPRRWWWSLLAGILSLFELAMLAGAVWLAVLALLDYLRMPVLEPPLIADGLPWPTALLLGGLVLRMAGGAVRRWLARRGAERYRGRVLDQLNDAVRDVAEERVLTPLRAELAVHAQLQDLLAVLQA